MRKLLERWGALTPIERILLRRAVAASVVARVALVFLPWKRLVARRAAADEGLITLTKPAAIALVRWAVGVSARRVPLQTCLSSALVARDLLGRCGLKSTLDLGTYLDEYGAIAFHAAVTSGGLTIGGEQPMTVLASFASA